jgi:hypothetical protein
MRLSTVLGQPTPLSIEHVDLPLEAQLQGVWAERWAGWRRTVTVVGAMALAFLALPGSLAS